MTHELLYTSAPQGLKPGSRGFCTVEMTDGIPPGLVDRLESLSAYRQAFPIHDPRAKDNPVNCSHLIVPAGGKRFHVLSRVADAGQDYTGRSNKLAHHVAIEPHERPAGNPAWVLRSPGFSQTSWNGTPRVLPSGRRAPSGTRGPAVCHAWKQAAGDAGWAGVLVASAVEPGAKPVSVIYPAGMDVLPLVEEALALVPGDRQWEVTFSTYFTKLPAGIDCQWRFILDDTPEARMLRRNAHAEVIDLCRTLGPPPPPRREFADLARRGRICVREGTPPPCPPPSPPPSAPPPIERSPRRLPLEPAPAAPASALVRAAVAAPSSFALSGGLPPDPSAASPDAPFPPASFPPASPPPPPPPSTQRAVEPPPDASADVTYGLLRNGPPPRTPASRATAADPWARRSPEQLVISPSEARGGTSSRRWAGRAALALAAVAAVAATAYVLGRGSHSNARHRPVGAQASNTGRPRDAAVQASPDSIRPRPQANPNDRTATAPPPGRNDASKSSNAPAAVSIHAAGSTPLPPLPDFYSQGSQAAYVPGTSLSEPPSNRAHGSPPAPLQQDNRLPYVVIGSARLVFESHRGNDQRDSGSGSANHLRLDDWLIVLPGAVAEVELRDRTDVIDVTVLGSAVIGLTKPKDSFRFIPALMIGEGRLILSKESSNSPTLELRLAGVPGGYRALSKASPASLGLGNGAVRAGVQVEHVQATGASPAKVFALQGSVHWPDRNSASPPPPQWLTGDYANDDPKNRLNKLEDEIKPGVYPLNDELDERLRRLLTRVRDGQSDARAKQLAKQSLTLLGSLR